MSMNLIHTNHYYEIIFDTRSVCFESKCSVTSFLIIIRRKLTPILDIDKDFVCCVTIPLTKNLSLLFSHFSLSVLRISK